MDITDADFQSQPPRLATYLHYLGAGWGCYRFEDAAKYRLNVVVFCLSAPTQWVGHTADEVKRRVDSLPMSAAKRGGLTLDLWLGLKSTVPTRVVPSPLESYLDDLKPVFLEVSAVARQLIAGMISRVGPAHRNQWSELLAEIAAFERRAARRQDFGAWLAAEHDALRDAARGRPTPSVIEMNDDVFWAFIDRIAQSREAAEREISQLSDTELRSFALRLQHALWDLDTPAVALRVYGKSVFPADEDFLFARAAIIARGRRATAAALEGHNDDPSSRVDWLADLADLEYERRTGRDLHLGAGWSSASGSNPQWYASRR
jgi:hypothetical protein